MIKIVMIVLSIFFSTGVYSSPGTDLNDFFNQLEKTEKRKDIKSSFKQVMNLKFPKPLFSRDEVRNVKLKTISVPALKSSPCSDFDSMFNGCGSETVNERKRQVAKNDTNNLSALEKNHE